MFETRAVFQAARFWLKADAKANICEQTQTLRTAPSRNDGRCGSIRSGKRSAESPLRTPKHGGQTHGTKCLHGRARADAGRKGRDQAIDATSTENEAQSYGQGIPPPCSRRSPCSTG